MVTVVVVVVGGGAAAPAQLNAEKKRPRKFVPCHTLIPPVAPPTLPRLLAGRQEEPWQLHETLPGAPVAPLR